MRLANYRPPERSDFQPLLSKTAQLQKESLSGPEPVSKVKISLNNQKALYFSKSSWQQQCYLWASGCPSPNNEEIIIIIKNYYYPLKYIECKQCAKIKNNYFKQFSEFNLSVTPNNHLLIVTLHVPGWNNSKWGTKWQPWVGQSPNQRKATDIRRANPGHRASLYLCQDLEQEFPWRLKYSMSKYFSHNQQTIE